MLISSPSYLLLLHPLPSCSFYSALSRVGTVCCLSTRTITCLKAFQFAPRFSAPRSDLIVIYFETMDNKRLSFIFHWGHITVLGRLPTVIMHFHPSTRTWKKELHHPTAPTCPTTVGVRTSFTYIIHAKVEDRHQQDEQNYS